MSSIPRLLATCAFIATAALPLSPLAAQNSGDGGDGGATGVPGAGGKGTIPPEDFGKWERLGRSVLSDDGRWVAVQIVRVNEENELQLRPAGDPDSVVVVPYGTGAEFSSDGRWVAYAIGMSEKASEKLREQRKPVRDDLGLMDLVTGETVTVEDVASFAFSEDGGYLAMRRYPPSGDRDAEGVDVVVRDLAAGQDVAFGNVSEMAWREEGALLAMVVDAEGMAGNGVRLWEPASGRLRTVDAAEARYEGLVWREDGDDLAVFRTVAPDDDDGWADTARVVVAARGVGGTPDVRTLPLGAAGFPDGFRVVPWQSLRWSEDGRAVFFGVQARTAEEAKCEDDGEDEAEAGDEEPGEKPGAGVGDGDGDGDGGDDCEDDGDEDDTTVEIWHAGDVDIVPTQKVRAGRDRQANDLVAWHLDADRVVRLEDDLIEDASPVDGTSLVVGLDEDPYDAERMFGPAYRDVWIIDLESGERRLALEGVQYWFGASPGGRWLLWLADDQYWTYDVESGRRRAITAELPTSFVDLEDDHTVVQKPPFGLAGWLEDDRAVLLYDDDDVWRVAPDGSGGERLTRGAEEGLRYRRARLDFDEDAIDPDEPWYFTLYDDWAETWGYGRADRVGAEVERLARGEARYYGLQKAEDADVYAWRVESFEDSPDLFLGDEGLDGRQITRTNPFQDDYLWGRSELIPYTNEWGDTLQGALFYPADYRPGESYPMITYIYEIRSSAVRSYDVPSERDYYNFQRWVQDGYFVFQPDIVYRDRDPGVSAVVNIEPAVQAVVDAGLGVDPERIGLIGHSWGGYQTTFFVTQSDLFAAAVAGAPLTNLFSMYLSVYWNSGGTDARIFEISQGRMEVPFWEDEDAYRRNSPVFHIENMRTPLLMAQGTEDGAVDFNQGVEFYNAARRAGKDFVFLVYNDENHGFRKEANQKDYHRRINEWFAHYLKGEPAPAWMSEGVPYLEQPGGRVRPGGGAGGR